MIPFRPKFTIETAFQKSMQDRSPPPPLPPTVDYATPGPYRNAPSDRATAPILSHRIALHVGAIAMAIFLTTMLGIPKLESVFKDFKVELPAITKFTLAISRLFNYWIVCVFFVMCALALPFLLSAMLGLGNPTREEIYRREKWVCRGLRLIALLTVLWLALSMIIPYATLIQSVSSPPKH